MICFFEQSVWNSFITHEQALLSQIFPANLFPANGFSFSSNVNGPFFRSAFDHFCDVLDCFRNLIRDVSRDDKCFTWIFLLLLLNLVLGMRLEWCLFPSFKGQTSDVSIVLNYFCCCPTCRNHGFRLYEQKNLQCLRLKLHKLIIIAKVFSSLPNLFSLITCE